MVDIGQIVDERHFPLWGLLASFVGLVFILTPALVYVSAEGEPFSIFNHFISELGELGGVN